MSTTIFENATVHTRLGRSSTAGTRPPDAQAMLVVGQRIALIGSVDECRDAAPAAAARVDLQGAHIAAAFIDAHVHTVQLATRSLEVDLSAADGFEQLAQQAGAALRAGAGRTDTGWLLGAGWNAGTWSDRRPADLSALDHATGDLPVALHSADLHAYWLNTAALTRLGVDPRLAPDGVVAEAPAFAVQHEIERSIRGTIEARILGVLHDLARAGVAGIHDIDDRIARETFQRLAADRALPLRVHKLTIEAELDEAAAAGIRTGSGDEWLDFGGVKLFSDGALGSHTCFLTEPFADRPDSHGVEAIDAVELRRAIARCADLGFSTAIHAIGDGAVRNAAGALAASRGVAIGAAVPHRIEHAQHVRHDDLALVARSGAVAVMQPESCTSDIDMVERRLGSRDLVSYGWRTLLDHDVPVAFSSDAPVEGIRPLHGIHAATTRQRPDATPAGGWQPHERLTRSEAWRAYTSAAARTAGHGDRGRLATGMLADFIVLDRDPAVVDATALRDAEVLRTVVGGTTRWNAQEPHTPPVIAEPITR
ncbi:amidohydrolase [Microbacterium esteraromaticum]|uniref:amidohydrolase n=1 Tax=Microbacterium esteraromaticum TaxID=57043 RepID=UPI00195A2E01|nr:amidohydrolase [Microbacterium esteraromaticum]MBM7466359.1 putative amidohydrolase YtcJ [Microbacterium esteraromaticum]